MSIRLLVATTNVNKLREIRSVLAGSGLDLVSLADVPPIEEPDETGSTFPENARLKARYYARHSRMLTVAEDSGLEVDAMNREPGVLSARFLGPTASYVQRFDEISRRLDGVPAERRTARFVCALALAREDEILFESSGSVEGLIADAPRGTSGFGYDPIFYYPDFDRTFGEVSGEQKLRVAHRGKAFRALAEWVEQGRLLSV